MSHTLPRDMLPKVLRPLMLVLFASMAYVAAEADRALEIRGVEQMHLGIYIEDLRTGEVVYERNADDLFVPASVTKSVTAAAAISVLEESGRFLTPVNAVGAVRDGVLEGDIVVATIGDPTIESRHFESRLGFADSIAAHVVAMGVKEVKGSVVIDQSSFIDDTVPYGWAEGDLSTYYGTLVHGANYRGNSSGKAAVKDPAAAMRSDIVKALEVRGVTVTADASVKPDSRQTYTLYIHKSPTVAEILRSLMVRSDNMMAEAMLRSLEPGRTRSQALAYERQVLQGVGVDFAGIAIYDGSGLSRKNRISPRFLADLYRMMYSRPDVRMSYARLFPRAGREGTMRNFLKDTELEGRVAMKTGSMTGVQCYGGYMLDDSGTPTHIIVVLANDFKSRDQLKADLQRFLLSLFTIDNQ